MHQRALAAVQSVPVRSLKVRLQFFFFTAVALQSRLVVIRPPGTNVVALTSGALQGRSFQRNAWI